MPSPAVTVLAAPSARNAPLAVAASVRTMPLIGRTELPAAQARERPGGVCSTRSVVGLVLVAPARFFAAWRILQRPHTCSR